MRRPLATLAVATVVSAGLIGGVGVTAASASTTSYLLPGGGADFPTWLFGTTTLCVTNLGPTDGNLEVRSRSPLAAPEYIPVGGFSRECIERRWYAVPVTATNLGNSPVSVTAK
jgi:hypothetical protein